MTIESKIGEGKCYRITEKEEWISRITGEEVTLEGEPYILITKRTRVPIVDKKFCESVEGGNRCIEYNKCY